MKKFFKEFSEFIQRGNVLDLAVGVIIGGAFQAIVTSLITNIISPVLGFICKLNFDNVSAKFFDDKVEIKYGAFITSVINFLVMAFVVFLLIKAVNFITSLDKRKKVEEPKPTTKKCPYCCSEIPIDAVRCPHCTSDLPQEEEAGHADGDA